MRGLGGRRPERFGAHHDPLAIGGEDQHVPLVVLALLGVAHMLGVEGVEVHHGTQHELLDAALAERQPGPLSQLVIGMLKGPGGGLQGRQPPDTVRGMLDGQVQDPISDIQVLLATRTVRQPADAHLPEHAVKRALMTMLDRPALHTPGVSNRIQTLLAHRTEIEMILKQAAQQLPPNRLQPSLEIPMLKPRGLTRPQPADDLLKLLARSSERIPTRTTPRREIHPSRITTALALQDFISRRIRTPNGCRSWRSRGPPSKGRR